MSETEPLFRIDPADNAAVSLRRLEGGTVCTVGGVQVSVLQDIPAGHKVALRGIKQGEPILKYGHPIGRLTRPVEAGEWVHEHNLRSAASGQPELLRGTAQQPPPAGEAPTFRGFPRADGAVGIRNEIWIVPTVGCVNSLAQQLARRLRQEGLPGSVDTAAAWPHPHGCSQAGEDLLRTQRILAGLVRHPNAGGVLVLGLGCETNSVERFQEVLGATDPERVKFLVAQDQADAVPPALEELRQLARGAGRRRREEVSMARLRVGLKCGGSDAFSGITANPLLGALTDRLVAAGGGAVLTEVPEMFGAEQVLGSRCVDGAVFQRFVEMIRRWREYHVRHGVDLSANPSPGNRAGGITTIEEKSLGCVRKGGSAPVTEVLDYGQRARRPGLSLLEAPGNDMVSLSALAAAGAQLVVFTTGCGTPLGGPVPTVKVSSTSALARRKKNWIDFDAGRLTHGTGIDELEEELLDYVREVASGRATPKAEAGDRRQIAIWRTGITL